MEIPDGDLVRLARDGDPAAFRLLVERHLPMARARAARLLHAAGVAVTAVDIEPAGEDVPELRSDTAAARVGLATAAGARHAVVSAGYGLALAAAAGAPVRVAAEVMGRLAVPVQGGTCWRRSCPRQPPGRRAVPGCGGVPSRGT